MIKIFKFILEAIAWVNILLIPLVIFGFIGLVIYRRSETTLALAAFAILSLSGLLVGIWAAEKIRKTIGCSALIFRVSSSKDISEWVSDEKK